MQRVSRLVCSLSAVVAVMEGKHSQKDKRMLLKSRARNSFVIVCVIQYGPLKLSVGRKRLARGWSTTYKHFSSHDASAAQLRTHLET